MSKVTHLKTNERAITTAIGNFVGAYSAAGKANAMIDKTSIELGATLDNNGMAMFVVVNAKEDANFENWFKKWGPVFGDDEDLVRKTYDACRKVIDKLRTKHNALVKDGSTTEGFSTMLQKVRNHMFLCRTHDNKGKDARKRATTKTNKSLFAKVRKVRDDKKPASSNNTPKVTASTFDAKYDALAKKLDVVQKAFAPINAYITDTQDDRKIIKASSDITATIAKLIESLESIKEAK